MPPAPVLAALLGQSAAPPADPLLVVGQAYKISPACGLTIFGGRIVHHHAAGPEPGAGGGRREMP